MLKRLCSLVIVLSAWNGSVAAEEMTFRAVGVDRAGTPLISATGQITRSTPTDFVGFLERNGEGRRPVVFINSPGGSVLASMELGKVLRAVGAEAIVARVVPNGEGRTAVYQAGCFSACVYAFMGARRRVVPVQSAIGIHRMFAYQDEADASGFGVVRRRQYDNGEIRARLMRYSSVMGVNPALIAAAEHISSDNIKILSQADIRRWHLAVSRP